MNKTTIISLTNLEYEIIPLDEAKRYLRVTDDHDDDLIRSLINAGVSFAESYIKRDIRRKTIIAISSEDYKITLPSTPLHSIIYIRSKKLGRVLIASEDYDIIDGKIILREGLKHEQIEIGYISGMDDIAESIKQAILAYLNLLYDKELLNQENLSSIYLMLTPYKIFKI